MSTKIFPLRVKYSIKKNDNKRVDMFVLVNNLIQNCLLDTGAEKHHICPDFCKRAKITVINRKENL